MDGQCAINEHMLLYIKKYVSKQVYHVHSDIVEYIGDQEEEVKLLGGIFSKTSQYTFEDYVQRVSAAGTIVDELMILLCYKCTISTSV